MTMRVARMLAAIAQRISRLPTWIFRGDADPAVPVDVSRCMTAALKTIKADVRYTELPGIGHNAWDAAYELGDLPIWLFKQATKLDRRDFIEAPQA